MLRPLMYTKEWYEWLGFVPGHDDYCECDKGCHAGSIRMMEEIDGYQD